MPQMPSADLVLAIRRATGESQEALARRLGVSFATVNAWERGRTEPRRVHRAQLVALAEGLGIRDRSEKTVLVIDDDPASCTILEAMVAESPVAAVAVSTTSASEGLLRCGALQPDVLFVDILMPGLDGFEVAARVRDIPGLENTRVILITSSRDARILQRARASGIEILLKPLDQAEVNAALGGPGDLPEAGAR